MNGIQTHDPSIWAGEDISCFRAAVHQLRQDKHQDMGQKKKTEADVSIMTQTGVQRFL
jgi:hypothetical protein